jgi:hypothetical protein
MITEHYIIIALLILLWLSIGYNLYQLDQKKPNQWAWLLGPVYVLYWAEIINDPFKGLQGEEDRAWIEHLDKQIKEIQYPITPKVQSTAYPTLTTDIHKDDKEQPKGIYGVHYFITDKENKILATSVKSLVDPSFNSYLSHQDAEVDAKLGIKLLNLNPDLCIIRIVGKPEKLKLWIQKMKDEKFVFKHFSK